MQIDKIELYVIKEQLERLRLLPYFTQNINQHLSKLAGIAEAVIQNFDSFPQDVSYKVAQALWQSVKFLSGSTLNETPYEMVWALDKAVGKWWQGEYAITTAFIDDKNYSFFFSSPHSVLQAVTSVQIELDLIQVALPKVYKHIPLYNVALYHELGHAIDVKHAISQSVCLQNAQQVYLPHIMEHFADIFAAAYTGKAGPQFLVEVFGVHGPSQSHPATQDRIDVVESFLDGAGHPIVDLLLEATEQRVGTKLEVEFSLPNISLCFDNIRPHIILNDKEMHGILAAGWDYVLRGMNVRADPWDKIKEYEAFRIVNDLIERSTRNYMTRARWNNGVA